MEILAYNIKYLDQILELWNNVIEEGIYFPQIEKLTKEEADSYFKSQDFTGIAVENDEVYGVYILHPNNIGRCGHICNASYAVSKKARGKGIGEMLVKDSMKQGAKLGYRILQFNAVVISRKIIPFFGKSTTSLILFFTSKIVSVIFYFSPFSASFCFIFSVYSFV